MVGRGGATWSSRTRMGARPAEDAPGEVGSMATANLTFLTDSCV